jgi:hypothetical protein
VPDATKNDTVREMEIYLATMIRQIDSSLEDEWERMKNPSFKAADEKPEVRPPGAEEAANDITRDTKAFTAAIRTRVFTFLRDLVNEDYDAAGGVVEWWSDGDDIPASQDSTTPSLLSAARLRAAMTAYHTDHQRLCLDPEARNARHTYVIPSEDKKTWRVQQVLVDPEGHNDWVAEFAVDLSASREAKEPIMKLKRIGSVA